MKFKYFNLICCFSLLFLVSCEKDRVFIEYDDLQKGAYARLIDGVNGEFDFLDIDNSGVDFTVEFYDENNGNNVESYAWTVNYLGSGPIPLASYDKSQFTPSPDGLPSVSIGFTFTQVLNALGITSNDLVGGTFFDLQATITKTDGSKFTVSNTGSNVVSSSPFGALFSIRGSLVNVPCKSDLNGTYDATATVTNQEAGIGWDGCDGNTWSGTVIFEGSHDPTVFGTGIYTMFTINGNGDKVEDASMGVYYGCYTGSLTDPTTLPLGDVRLNVDCGAMFFTGSSQWGEAYTVESVTVDGEILLLAWTNDYGEGGSVRMTRTDGTNWPTDLKKG